MEDRFKVVLVLVSPKLLTVSLLKRFHQKLLTVRATGTVVSPRSKTNPKPSQRSCVIGNVVVSSSVLVH